MSHVVVRGVSQLSVTDLVRTVRLCLAAEIQLNQAQSEMGGKTEGALKSPPSNPKDLQTLVGTARQMAIAFRRPLWLCQS